MVNSETRAYLGTKLHQELKNFMDYELVREKDEIIADAFKIDMVIEIYEALLEVMDQENQNESTMKALIAQPNSIRQLYLSWIEENGDNFTRVKEFIMEKGVA